MHRHPDHYTHGHHHHDDGEINHPHPHQSDSLDHRAGHNRPNAVSQWQVLHESDDAEHIPGERDLDLVEISFVEAFGRAPDPTSFLRLASIPFVGVDANGRRLHLLRVEIEGLTDIGAVSPLIGGEGVRYDPLPARMVSQRRRLFFVYHDGHRVTRLLFSDARALRDESGPSQFAVASAS